MHSIISVAGNVWGGDGEAELTNNLRFLKKRMKREKKTLETKHISEKYTKKKCSQ